jgi:hypothetical protein
MRISCGHPYSDRMEQAIRTLAALVRERRGVSV